MYCKNIIVICFILIAFTSFVSARIWIVDNNVNGAGDFTTLAAAHGTAANGDTIYVYPSVTPYAGITLTKQLYIIGSGFDLDLHGGQATTTAATIGSQMNFNPGSEGSLLEGFDGSFNVYILANNITIKRNDLNWIGIQASSCRILQNEIIMMNGSFGECIWLKSGFGDHLIANNKLFHSVNGTNKDGIKLEFPYQVTATFINNVIKTTNGGAMAFRDLSSSCIAINNIIIQGGVSGSGVFQYNMANGSQLPPGVGNIGNINMTTVFEDPNDFESGLHLRPGSPAIGAGQNGIDMGIYGGDAPYIDGGAPGIPAVFSIDAEVVGGPGNDLQVNFQAKSNAK